MKDVKVYTLKSDDPILYKEANFQVGTVTSYDAGKLQYQDSGVLWIFKEKVVDEDDKKRIVRENIAAFPRDGWVRVELA